MRVHLYAALIHPLTQPMGSCQASSSPNRFPASFTLSLSELALPLSSASIRLGLLCSPHFFLNWNNSFFPFVESESSQRPDNDVSTPDYRPHPSHYQSRRTTNLSLPRHLRLRPSPRSHIDRFIQSQSDQSIYRWGTNGGTRKKEVRRDRTVD